MAQMSKAIHFPSSLVCLLSPGQEDGSERRLLLSQPCFIREGSERHEGLVFSMGHETRHLGADVQKSMINIASSTL